MTKLTRAELEKQRLAGLAAKVPAQKVTVPNIKAPESNNSVKPPEAQVTNSNNSPVLAQKSVPAAVPSVPAVTPVAPVEEDFPDYETWKAKNPTKNSLEYAYEVTQPKPKPVDPEKEKRDRKMSSLVDLGSLLIETGGVMAGGKAFNRTTTATGEVDAKYQRLHDLYTRQRDNYSAGKMQAIYRDLANDKQGYMQARQDARAESASRTEHDFRTRDANTKHDRDVTAAQIKAENDIQLYGKKVATATATKTSDQNFTANQNQLNRNATAANNAATNARINSNKQAADEGKAVSAANKEAIITEFIRMRKANDVVRAANVKLYAAGKTTTEMPYKNMPLPDEPLTPAAMEVYVRAYGSPKLVTTAPSTTPAAKDFSGNKRPIKKDFSKFKR